MTGKPHLQVTAAVTFHRGRVMITKRPPGSRHAGAWEFPGGKQEPGESLPECLSREIREELDLDVEVDGPLISVDHDYGDLSLTLHAFRCRLGREVAAPPDRADLVWLEPEKLPYQDMLPPDRRIVDFLLDGQAKSR